MKKLWITGVSLSIFLGFQFLQADLPGQENLVPNRGKGTCWTVQKGINGFNTIKFHTKAPGRCGNFVALEISRDLAGSDVGWPSGLYVKLQNVKDPNGVWYSGGGVFENQQGLLLGDNAEIACYGCKPKTTGITGNLPVNCSPNDGDPAKRAACWQGYDALDCSTQVDCDKVIDIPQCYPDNAGIISASQPDYLKLCPRASLGGENYGPGPNSVISGTTQAMVQQNTIFGAKGAATNLSPETGLATAPPATARVAPAV